MLDKYILVGNTETQAFLEKIVGYLGGFSLLLLGMTRWLPGVSSAGELRLASSLIEQADEGIIMIDLAGTIQLANDTWAQMHGYPSPADVVGRTIGEFVSDQHNIPWLGLNQREAARTMSMHTRLDGREFPVEMYYVPFAHLDGSPAGVMGFAQDRTTSESSRRELILAKARANAANAAKTRFLISMSHELRTPMSAILGFAKELEDPDVSEEQRIDYARRIERNGLQLLELVNDILDLSKVESGKLDVDLVPASILEVMNGVMALLEPHARVKGLEFTAAYVGEIPETITTDPSRLQQALVCLVNNAIKFTDAGSVQVRISLLPEWRRSTPALEFEVIDTGMGIPSDSVDRVVHSSHISDEDASARYFSGSGLGLTITRSIAGLLGGKLAIESTPNRGSKSTLIVPVGDLTGVPLLYTPEALTPHKTVEQDPAQADQPLRGAHILLAENAPDQQVEIAALLRQAGAYIDVAANGQLAVDRIMATPTGYDLILMDAQMPVMSGRDAILLIREKRFHGPIIVLAERLSLDDRANFVQAGCSDFCTKPIDPTELLAMVTGYIQSATQH